MYRLYEDIRRKLGEPEWHDEQGVPRYCTYHPECGGVYDRWAALLEIECQSCARAFLVSSSYSTMDMLTPGWKAGDPDSPRFPTATSTGSFYFGDAPWHTVPYSHKDNIDGQCAGTTMTTRVRRVVEFWIHGHVPKFEWVRHPEFEFIYPEPV